MKAVAAAASSIGIGISNGIPRSLLLLIFLLVVNTNGWVAAVAA